MSAAVLRRGCPAGVSIPSSAMGSLTDLEHCGDEVEELLLLLAVRGAEPLRQTHADLWQKVRNDEHI